MQAWIGQIQGLAFHLEQAGISVSDQDKILAITMGLPSTYDAVIINFDSTPSDQLTLNHVFNCLLNEEVQQSVIISLVPACPANGDVICFFCNKKGHYKSECPEKKAWEKMKAKGESRETAATIFDWSDEESYNDVAL
ncbi:hypothetical protein CPB84DRAFT_1687193 [Gymnopilus junonius]|uniref:CCHC-type domain-containing protein n=1 Tax=Gymnopilus junonius TaxID=109634 RepID=A0A9P5NG59_GYMJU|nr:hypothetical protein CPB84DRAFT_1687193 [Gymnopilus junonius]